MEIIYLEEVDSTNKFVRERFEELSDGDFVVARVQTAGRGRRERRWQAPAGVNITGTLCIKGTINPFHSGCILGLAALEVLREEAPELDFFLKWPNDVYVGDAKIAGILCESCGFSGGRMRGIAAGIGLNVNMPLEAVAKVTDNRAVSLLSATGRVFNLEKITEKLANSLSRYYIMCNRDSAQLTRLWREENRLIGEELELIFDDGSRRSGVFAAIAEDGCLELLEPSGNLRRFSCADVRIDRAKIDFEKLKQKRFKNGNNNNRGI